VLASVGLKEKQFRLIRITLLKIEKYILTIKNKKKAVLRLFLIDSF